MPVGVAAVDTVGAAAAAAAVADADADADIDAAAIAAAAAFFSVTQQEDAVLWNLRIFSSRVLSAWHPLPVTLDLVSSRESWETLCLFCKI